MRIKKLEISGFKSFCDRTVLHFRDPITGIVGPNGCGKSNVVDAIRWCMGEQSAKYLRGKAMEDVIFAGSDARGPASLAEVSLTFENDGRVPVEVLAFSEITVTRRLFRDGQSEYLLNNTVCRLRDITDFFLGTGIGTKAYSIIEQGKVGMIVSSKPEDRRFFIEEAAGITKYKLKKKAAEKKIDSTRQNLLRVSDVVAELDKQLGSLKRQAQKAERYKQYRAELRDLELWSAAQRWLGFLVETRFVETQLGEESRRKGDLQTDVVAREAELQAVRLRATEQERQISSRQQQLYELDNRIKLGEAESEHEAREAQGLEERARQAEVELALVSRQIEETAAEHARVQADLAAVDAARADEQEMLDERERIHRGIKEELALVQRDIDAAKTEIAQAQTDIARSESSERLLLRRSEELELRLGRVAEEEARLGVRGEELRRQIAAITDTLTLQKNEQARIDAARETHQARLDELKRLIDGHEPEAEKKRHELSRRRSRYASLEELLGKYEGFGRGTQAIMQEYVHGQGDHRGDDKESDPRWGVRGLVADVLRVAPGYEVAVEAALGDRLGAVVVDSHEVGLGGIDFLKQRSKGRSSFVPLRARPVAWQDGSPTSGATSEDALAEAATSDDATLWLIDQVKCDQEYVGLTEALVGDVLVVEDLLEGIDRWRAGERRPMVTREGELVDALGVMTGGTREVRGAGVLEKKRELRELEEHIAKLEQEHREQVERLAGWREEQQELVTLLDGLRRARHQADLEVLTHEKDAHRLSEELARLDTRGEALAHDRAEILGHRRETAHEAGELVQVIRNARERLVQAEERREARGRRAVTLLDRQEEAAAALTEFKIVAAKSEEKRAALGQTRARIEAQLNDADTRRSRLERSRVDGLERAGALRERAAARQTELLEHVATRQSAEADLIARRDEYEALHGTQLQLEAEIKEKRATLEGLVKTVSELELKLRELQWHKNHLEEQVIERWRVVISLELGPYHLRAPFGDSEERRLRELRELIERMGEINLTAIDEYHALDERYRFLVAQKEDLEAALGQLEEAIAEINRASRRRFREVFDLVNQKFQELFPRLFRGGRAYLILTRPSADKKAAAEEGGVEALAQATGEDDILESGVEIVAQPPGKKNTTIELLSGGEKALTAVSLIFAIFLVKPSPFCLLDEVDAPLDEANVGRFNDLVRAMTDRSQFILITHNKRTMEIADTLYGVTMEQPGISKLVSVNLTEVGRKAA